jgi:hypothetical protein
MRIWVSLILCLSLVSCVSVKSNDSPAPPPPRDPWQGRYRHFSGKFELVLKHFSPKYLDVEVVRVPIVPGQRPHAYFFAVIKGSGHAVFQAPSERDCRVELDQAENGILLSDFCHGTGEDVGLYRSVSE